MRKSRRFFLPCRNRSQSTFAAYWDLDCTLVFGARNQQLAKSWWQIVVLDNPDQAGVLGYHEISSQGTPLGKAFAKLDISNGTSWTVTLSHELLEMLADPWTKWCAVAIDNQIYALEVADPLEADALGYEIDGVRVSDFITPAWFEPTEADRLDFKQRLSKQLEIAPGGYISVLDPTKGWTQITAKGEGGPKAALGSRRCGGESSEEGCGRRVQLNDGLLLLPSPAHAFFGLLDDDAGGGEFGANRVGFRVLFGGTRGFHLLDFLIDLIVGRCGGTDNVEK